MTRRTTASALRPGNWSLLTKILIGMVTVAVLPMGVLTALNEHGPLNWYTWNEDDPTWSIPGMISSEWGSINHSKGWGSFSYVLNNKWEG